MNDRTDPRDGSAVWLDYDQAALDRQYEQRTLVPDPSPYEREWRAASEAARALPGCRPDLAYGDGARERLDLFVPDGDGPWPLLVFFHGGAWTRFTKYEFGYPASTLVPRGVAWASVDFDLVPDVRLEVQCRQARTALDWLVANAGDLGLDASSIVVAGHSSGAHVAATMITHCAVREPAAVRAALLVSGIYDLEPVRLSARNGYVRLDEAQAAALSPIEHIPRSPCPIVVAWGDGELDEFQRQSASFAEAWARAGGTVERHRLRATNHFEIPRVFAAPERDPLRAALARLGAG